MNMTHYMQLLADNQPWNLLIFMAIPIVLAETLAITELYILFTRKFDGFVYHLNRFSGTTVGLYFIGIIAYLMTTAVVPITKGGEWRTAIDVVAVSSYLIGGLPLIWIALQEFGFVNIALDQMGKLKIHAICVALFLVFGHIAMIAGMLDPSLLGYKGSDSHQMGANTGHDQCDPAMYSQMMQIHPEMMGNMTPTQIKQMQKQMPICCGNMQMCGGNNSTCGGQIPKQMPQNMSMGNSGHNH
jgi:hypothetical protein